MTVSPMARLRPHPNETIKMSVASPDPANPEARGAGTVHIDANRAPYRQATVAAPHPHRRTPCPGSWSTNWRFNLLRLQL